METLLPCVTCGRHVRASERDCPFRGAALEAPQPRRAVAATVRLATRAAIFAGATLLTPACGAEPAADAPPSAVLSPTSTATTTSMAAPGDEAAAQGPKLEPAGAAVNPTVVLTPLPSTLAPTDPPPADTAAADVLATAEAERVAAARSRRREAARVAAEERRRQPSGPPLPPVSALHPASSKRAHAGTRESAHVTLKKREARA